MLKIKIQLVALMSIGIGLAVLELKYYLFLRRMYEKSHHVSKLAIVLQWSIFIIETQYEFNKAICTLTATSYNDHIHNTAITYIMKFNRHIENIILQIELRADESKNYEIIILNTRVNLKKLLSGINTANIFISAYRIMLNQSLSSELEFPLQKVR